MLESEGFGLIEVSYKSWDTVPPNTYLNRNIPIDAGYCTPDMDITNFCMLPFINCPRDHRAWIIEVTTISMLGEHLLKID